MGQYYQPTSRHLPVKEYVSPEKFDSYRKRIEKMGFAYVVAGPFVRASYKAGELFIKNMLTDDSSITEHQQSYKQEYYLILNKIENMDKTYMAH